MHTRVLAETTKHDDGNDKFYQVLLADTVAEVTEAQRFRYSIFAEDLGAQVPGAECGLDADRFDDYCSHIMVRLNGKLIGYTRILTCDQARLAGGFYSQTEFDLKNILDQQGRFMEIGRTCIHPDQRNGTTISMLWSGLARFMSANDVDYLMGCASIPVERDGADAAAAIARLKENYYSPDALRVYPRTRLPRTRTAAGSSPGLPPLLKGYLRVGAKICGEPHWDREFGVADLFILLRRSDLDNRYARHFIERPRKAA